MRPSAYLINVSRGPVVDEPALIRALQDGQLAGAGLDVYDPEPPEVTNPLLGMPNVVVTPHVASNTVEGIARMSNVGGRPDRSSSSAAGIPSFLLDPAAWPGRTVVRRDADRREIALGGPAVHSNPWTTSAGSRVCRSSTARPSAPTPTTLPPSLQGLPPRSVPETAPDAAPAPLHQPQRGRAHLRRDRDHRARARGRRSAARWSSCASSSRPRSSS